MNNICNIDGCLAERKCSNGLCWKHDSIRRRHGDPNYVRPNREGHVENGIAYLPLTQSAVAMLDPEDYLRLVRFRWKLVVGSGNKLYAGRCVRENGKTKTIRLHHAIIGRKDDLEVDHKNGNGLDNRKCNLRFATPSQNKANRAKKSGCKMSRFKGVAWHGRDKLWIARITVNRKNHNIRYCKDEEDAAIYYDVAARLFFGEFAQLNFPHVAIWESVALRSETPTN